MSASASDDAFLERESEPVRPDGPDGGLNIRELARRLKLGKTTVALALKDSRLVSEATRQRVQQSAREMGYTPNPAASAFLQQIRSQGTKRYQSNLAFIVPPRVRYLHQLQVLEGAQARARELGYGMDLVKMVPETSPARLTRLLLARGVQGIAVGPMAIMSRLKLDWSKFPGVTFGYSMVRPAIHRIVPNHAQAIRTAFLMCRRKGYKRIGLVLSHEANARSNRLWTSTFLDIQARLPDARRVAPFYMRMAKFSKRVMEAWAARERPDVVIIHALGSPPGIEDILNELGLPLAVLDWVENEPCAGIDPQFYHSGKLMVDVLSAQILHNQRGIPSMPILSSVEGVWRDHHSLPVAG